MPKVSVIIPNYNHANYLQERIESVLSQSFQDFEVIILDDNSTDNSLDVINQYKNHPKVKQILTYNENSGSTFKQWNKGINYAKGEWIWIAESDDSCEKNFLESLLQNVGNNQNIVLSYSQSSRMNGVGEITGNWKTFTHDISNQFSNSFVINGEQFVHDYLSIRNVIPNASAVIFRKDAFVNAGKADEDIRYNSDWLLWIKLALLGDISFCKQTLNHFRYHEKSVIAKSKNEHIIPFLKKYDIIMFERILKQLKSDKGTLIKKIKHQIAEFSFQEGVFLFDKNFKREAFKFWKKYYTYSSQKKISVKRIFKVILHQ